MSSSSSLLPSPASQQYCSVCGHQSSLRCSNCIGALYCSVTCQRKDWKSHKVICKEAEEVKKNFEEHGYRTVEEVDSKLEIDRRLAELGDAGVDKAEGVKWYKLAAAQGIVGAQFNLGAAYSNGNGVSVDKAEAVKWYKLAAAQGNAGAQYNLGSVYSEGDGVTIDKVEAVKWYRLAAVQGLADAQLNLGNAYIKGDGVSIDKAEAVKWFRLAAAQGLAGAQFNMGALYLNGEGVDIDKVEGSKWMKLDAENGSPDAITYLKSHHQPH